ERQSTPGHRKNPAQHFTPLRLWQENRLELLASRAASSGLGISNFKSVQFFARTGRLFTCHMASLKRSAEEALDSHGDRERGASGQSAEISSCVGGPSQDEETPKTGNAPPPKSSLENHPAHQEVQLHLTGALPKLVVLDLDKTV
ncbi:unnamed protein product, partial [Ectocarpus sp. 6 AP-2014]